MSSCSSADIEFSICIPSYNRCQQLKALLLSIKDCIQVSALNKQGIEVLVVLDGGTDNSKEMIAQVSREFPVRLHMQWQKNQGLSAARNTLAKLAIGSVIWYLDDDMEITTHALLEHYHWDRSGMPILCGPSYVEGDEGLALFYEYRWRHLSNVGFVDKPQSMSFANTSAPRELILSYKFSSKLKGYGLEDYELAIRLLSSDIKIAFAPNAKVIHYYDKSGMEILANIQEEGQNRVMISRLHPVAGRFALEVEPRRFGEILLWACRKRFHRTLWFAAHVTRVCSTLFKGKKATRFIRFSNDMALYSGFAKAGGTPMMPVDANGIDGKVASRELE